MGQHPKVALARSLRAHLAGGGVIAHATESCFGLACNPRDRRAVIRLCRIKGRPVGKGLILILHRAGGARRLVCGLDQAGWRQVDRPWPGPVTWLLPPSRRVPVWVRGRHPKVALRVPGHGQARIIAGLGGGVLVSTSANPAGQRPARDARSCRRRLGPGVRVVSGRVGRRRRPSTIMSLDGQVLRA